MNDHPRTVFFDGIAETWDGFEDLSALQRNLAVGLAELGVGGDETVLDIGCGTGNLTLALLARLSPAGRVEAVDIAPQMITVARRKIADTRVTWHTADALRLPLGAASCNRVICYSVWPHFDNRKAIAAELARVLIPGGRLHVWHLIARQRVNAIHAAAGAAVCRDLLPPAQQTADLLADIGLQVATVVDCEQRYLVTAAKPAR